MSTSKIQLRKVARDSFRAYFAPLVGAFSAIREEASRMDHERNAHTGATVKVRTNDSHMRVHASSSPKIHYSNRKK